MPSSAKKRFFKKKTTPPKKKKTVTKKRTTKQLLTEQPVNDTPNEVVAANTSSTPPQQVPTPPISERPEVSLDATTEIIEQTEAQSSPAQAQKIEEPLSLSDAAPLGKVSETSAEPTTSSSSTEKEPIKELEMLWNADQVEVDPSLKDAKVSSSTPPDLESPLPQTLPEGSSLPEHPKEQPRTVSELQSNPLIYEPQVVGGVKDQSETNSVETQPNPPEKVSSVPDQPEMTNDLSQIEDSPEQKHPINSLPGGSPSVLISYAEHETQEKETKSFHIPLLHLDITSYIAGIATIILIVILLFVLKNNLFNQPTTQSNASQTAITASTKPIVKTASPSATIKPTPLPTLSPSQIKVRVLNGSRTARAASTVATQLHKLGYYIDYTGNATSSAFPQTLVRVKPNDSSISAQIVKALQPSHQALVNKDLQKNATYDVEIIIGKQ